MTKAKPRPKATAGKVGGQKSLKTDWQTPEHILEGPRRYFGGAIPFDPFTASDNPTKARRYCAPAKDGEYHLLGVNGGEWLDQDGLHTNWMTRGGGRGFANPPYGNEMNACLGKMAHEARQGFEGLFLVTCSRFEQPYFVELLRECNAVCFVRGRIAFRNPETGDYVNGMTYSSMILGSNIGNFWRFRWALEPLAGSVKMMERGETSACFELRGL